MLTHCQSRSPIKRLLNKITSIQTYVNYHKTHAMATHFGGIGITPVEDTRTQESDNVSEGNPQEEDLMKQLICKTEYLKQVVEDKNNKPREAIQDLEQRLNNLTLALHRQNNPIENMLDRYTETLCTTQKKTSLESSLLQDIPIFKWARSFTT